MMRVIPLAALVFVLGPAWLAQMSWDQIRSIAESQHEIATLLIEKKQFRKAVEEAKKIFYLPFPEEKDDLLVEAAKEISDALTHHKQHDLALEILDEALRSVQIPQLQAELYQEKAYLYKKMGKDQEAMENFRKAVELKDPGR